MSLQDSPFSSVKLQKNPQRFLTLLGVSVEQFDAIFEKLYEYDFLVQLHRHRLWRKERVEKMVKKSAPTLREYLCITLLYIRQYNIQEVLATSFDISQAHVSVVVNRTSKMLEHILPTPEKTVEALTERISQIDPKLRDSFSATMIIDASEQRIERSQDKQKQRADYSGKKNVTTENSKSSSPQVN